MAAHLINAINYERNLLLTLPETDLLARQIPQLQTALILSCWTEQLDLKDYLDLKAIVEKPDRVALLAWFDAMLAKYTPEWEQLCQPKNMEAWLKAKYPG